MRLARIKLAGFKSFVDPTTVLTPGQLVGIVGPNGCGKSNVIDAVRWVLGESRASALRGESMQDVIFNGSNTRKPAARASVELVFDNAEGKLGGQWKQYAELSVKRVLDRSGESEYLINQQKVRRKDVIDLFLGTGLGPRAYAIIEQGMISRVIEARPEEVRAFLEEAAGISRYKERRRETEGRLSDARDNLVRLEDIRAELGQQVARLSGQAELATRYQSLSTDLRQKQLLLWQLKHANARREHSAAQQGIVTALSELDGLNNRLQTVEHDAELGRAQHAEASEAVGIAQGELYAASAEVSRVESELRQLREARNRLAQRIHQLETDSEQWAQREGSLAQEQQRWTDLRAAAALRETNALAEQEIAAARLPETEETHRGARETLDELRRKHAQTEQQLRVEEARKAALQRSLDGLLQRAQGLQKELDEVAAQARPDLAASEMALAEAQERLLQIETQLADAQARLENDQATLKQTHEAERHAQRQATELRARIDALQNLQARLQAGELGDWLHQMGLQDIAPLWKQIRVDAGWETAVEAVLRERLTALPRFDAALPAQSLDNAAPVTIMLLSKAAASNAPQSAMAGLQPLAERLRADDAGIASHLHNWLRGVFSVDALAPWLTRQAEIPAGVTLVCPAGNMLSADALTLFAPDARTHGAVERQREIETQRSALDEAEATHQREHARVAECEAAQRNSQEAVQEARRALQAAQQQQHAAQMEHLTRSQAAQRIDERSQRLQREIEEIARMQDNEALQAEQSEARVELLREQSAQMHEELDAAQRHAQLAEQAWQSARSALEACNRNLQEAQFSLRECDSRLQDIVRNVELARSQHAQGQGALQTQREELDAFDEAALTTALEAALAQRDVREAALAGRRDALESASARLRTLDEERLRTEHALSPLRDRVSNFRLAEQAAELAAQQAIERLAEIDAAPDDDNPALADQKEMSLTREVARLNREIAELGPVNLAALKELETASERKSFLDAQWEDLMQAVGTLEDAIRRIDRETRTLLADTYNTVNRQFGELFPQLFGGGEAQLVLTGDEILDAGVQIVARPPGKKNTSIQLLSGGEKALTAIALVFSMFQLNPAPFCMLDEVDAPLDDSNTERYCAMVKRMSAVTQFVFISHSKITMEIGQQLVGVTMQEQGVSRIVEVDIDAAMQLAQVA